jgi:hypothetical protein
MDRNWGADSETHRFLFFYDSMEDSKPEYATH